MAKATEKELTVRLGFDYNDKNSEKTLAKEGGDPLNWSGTAIDKGHISIRPNWN